MGAGGGGMANNEELDAGTCDDTAPIRSRHITIRSHVNMTGDDIIVPTTIIQTGQPEKILVVKLK